MVRARNAIVSALGVAAFAACGSPPPAAPKTWDVTLTREQAAALPVIVVSDVDMPLPDVSEECKGKLKAMAAPARDTFVMELIKRGFPVGTDPSKPHAFTAKLKFALGNYTGSMWQVQTRYQSTSVMLTAADGTIADAVIEDHEWQDGGAGCGAVSQDYAKAAGASLAELMTHSKPLATAADQRIKAATPTAPAAQPEQKVAAASAPAPSPAPAPAPEPAKPSTVPTPSFIGGAQQPNTFALVVGIEKYRDAPAAKAARIDAEHFAELAKRTLGVRSENLHLLVDDRATRSDIETQMAWLKSNVPAGGRVIFFFSGHGAPDASAGTPYVLPYDGSPKSVASSALPLQSVLRALSETKASQVVAFVDSCFSGAGGRSVLPPGARPLVRVKEAPASAQVILFSAASGAQISGPTAAGDEGLFTKYLVDGLGSGGADIDGDGQISVQELSDWVTPRVSREAKRESREQTPSMSVGNGVSGGARNVIVASGLSK